MGLKSGDIAVIRWTSSKSFKRKVVKLVNRDGNNSRYNVIYSNGRKEVIDLWRLESIEEYRAMCSKSMERLVKMYDKAQTRLSESQQDPTTFFSKN
jgi:hypothetical protein